MDEPSTPIQAVQAWLAAQTPASALAGVPIGVLLDHFLQSQARGLPSAGHELQVLGVLLDHWLKRLQRDIDSFAPAAVAVLQVQKKALQGMHAALTELQLCLQSVDLSQVKPVWASKRGRQRPKSWATAPDMPVSALRI